MCRVLWCSSATVFHKEIQATSKQALNSLEQDPCRVRPPPLSVSCATGPRYLFSELIQQCCSPSPSSIHHQHHNVWQSQIELSIYFPDRRRACIFRLHVNPKRAWPSLGPGGFTSGRGVLLGRITGCMSRQIPTPTSAHFVVPLSSLSEPARWLHPAHSVSLLLPPYLTEVGPSAGCMFSSDPDKQHGQ